MALTVLDAGVIIAVLDGSDTHHEAASREVTNQRSNTLVVPASAYAEILVRPLRRGFEEADYVDQFLAQLPATIAPADRIVARRAAELRAAHGNKLRLPDALVISTALLLEADMLMTTDATWPDLPINVLVVSG